MIIQNEVFGHSHGVNKLDFQRTELEQPSLVPGVSGSFRPKLYIKMVESGFHSSKGARSPY